MHTINSVNLNKTLPVSTPPTGTTYRLGQLIKATTVSGTPEGRLGGPANLRIGNQLFQVRSHLQLIEGDQLTLQVSSINPRILLSVVSINGVQPTAPSDPIAQQLIKLQPRQGGLPIFFSALNSLLRNPARLGATSQSKIIIEEFFNTLITRNETTRADYFRQMFLSSGIFLESKLAELITGKRRHINRDFKSSLFSLLNGLNHERSSTNLARLPTIPSDLQQAPLPPNRNNEPIPQPRIKLLKAFVSDKQSALQTLQQLGEAALARITLHQINTVENLRDGYLRWLVEIPIRHGQDVDILHFRIDQEPRGSKNPKEKWWTARLALDLPELGAMQVSISLNHRKISSVFSAEQTHTTILVKSQLQELGKALEAHGLRVATLACHQGVPSSESAKAPPSRSLLNLQA